MFQVIQRNAEGDVIRKEYGRVTDAIAFAEKASIEEVIELEVVDATDGTVIRVTTWVPETESFNPWTRVETPKFTAPHLPGWRPAYTRKRVGAVVYRSLEAAEWLVLDTRTGGREVVKTTALAREVTNQMRAGRVLEAKAPVVAGASHAA
jgi:hypothetical protein